MKPKYLHDKDPWMLAEDIPEIDLAFSEIWLSSFVNDLERTTGKNYKKVLGIFRGYKMQFYYGKKDSDDFAKHLLALLKKNPKFGEKINKNIRIYSKKLKSVCKKIDKRYLARFSNRELAKFYIDLDKLHTTLYTWGWLPNAVDMFHGNFTGYLKSILSAKLPADEVNSALVALTASPEKSVLQQEHESLLKLAAMKQKKAKDFEKALNNHLNKYFYLKHLWLGLDGVYDKKYYLGEIDKFLKSGEAPAKLLRKENSVLVDTLKKRQELIKELKLSRDAIALFDVYAEFAVTKLYRRDAQIFWSYKMGFVFDELKRRFKIPLIYVRFMSPWEVRDALTGGLESKLKKELKTRVKYCAYYAEKGVNSVLYGRDARKIEDSIQVTPTKGIKELEGQTACLGKAKGKVRIINVISDMRKMEKGDILVSIATNPDIVPAMKKAAAIVTEQGGITSHAAIVSRELGIPCVIGTKIATKVFKDGDLVEVDANKGIVRKL
jgi:phosphohistidine swiveling domain-containing protein